MIKQNQKYTMFDYIKIPFKIAPVKLSIIFLIKIAIYLIPFFYILTTASFINKALGVFAHKNTVSQIYFPLIMIIVLVAFDDISAVLVDIVATRVKLDLSENLNFSIIEKRAKLEYKYIENNETWELICRVCNDPDNKIFDGFNSIISLVGIIIYIVSIAIALVTQVWWIAFILILASVPLFYIAIKTGRKQYEENKKAVYYNRRADYYATTLSSRESVEERSLFRYTDAINERWHKNYEKSRKIYLKTFSERFLKNRASGLFMVVIAILITISLISPLENGVVSVGMFIGLVNASFGLINSISWKLPWLAGNLTNSKEYLKDLEKFSKLKEVDNALDFPDKKIQNEQVKTIEFKNVSFAYPGTDKLILKNFSLKLFPYKHYSFVGVNGAGKTTITKILTGMYDNYEGEILIGGRSLKNYNLAELKGMFSVVFQDFAKYFITLRGNIELGDAGAKNHDDNEFNEILKSVELYDKTYQLPEGLDTNLGKIRTDSVDLSGGQWQKVAIARSLYNKAPFRILDEPTAALDPVAESKVYEIFGEISKGHSTIFITHRLGAARLADEIIVIENGTVHEQGSHDELMASGGIYHDMFLVQRSWYE